MLGRVFVGEPSRRASGCSARSRSAWPCRSVPATRGPAATPTPQPVIDASAGGATCSRCSTPRQAAAPCASSTPTGTAAPSRSRPSAGPRGGPRRRGVGSPRSSGARPSLELVGAVRLDMEPRTRVVLDGLLVSGGAGRARRGRRRPSPRTIVIRDCDARARPRAHARRASRAAPTRASLVVLDPVRVVRIERSVVGPIVAVEGVRVEVVDSIVDASARTAVAIAGARRAVAAHGDDRRRHGGGRRHGRRGRRRPHASRPWSAASTAPCSMRRTACWSPTLAAGDPRPHAVRAERRQDGCVRYSLPARGVPHGPPVPLRAATPRTRSGCAARPGRASARCATATRRTCGCTRARPTAIRRGADDESEMGVTHLLYAPQREANLLIRLDEYLRFGLAAEVLRDMTIDDSDGHSIRRGRTDGCRPEPACGSTPAATTPAWSCSRAACCSTPTGTSWSRSSSGACGRTSPTSTAQGPRPGIAGVAVVPRTTPDAFRVTLAGGALTIGRGRMYVDGLARREPRHGRRRVRPDARGAARRGRRR